MLENEFNDCFKIAEIGGKCCCCGISGRIFEAKRKDSIKIIENGKKMVLHGDLTGKVEKVNVQLIKMLLKEDICLF